MNSDFQESLRREVMFSKNVSQMVMVVKCSKAERISSVTDLDSSYTEAIKFSTHEQQLFGYLEMPGAVIRQQFRFCCNTFLCMF